MNDFRKLLVWQKGINIVSLIYTLVANFPKEEKYGLASQMSRAAVSISSNIAEGSSREGKKDYTCFLEIALGSAYELETQIIAGREIGIISKEKFQEIIKVIHEEQKMLSGFIRTLKT